MLLEEQISQILWYCRTQKVERCIRSVIKQKQDCTSKSDLDSWWCSFAHSTYGLSLELVVGNFHGFQRVRSDQLRREQECQNGHWRTDQEELKVRPQWRVVCLPKGNSNETKWSIHGYTPQNKTTVLKKKKAREVTCRDGLGEIYTFSIFPSLSSNWHQSHQNASTFRIIFSTGASTSTFEKIAAVDISWGFPGWWLKIPSLKLTCQEAKTASRLTTIFQVLFLFFGSVIAIWSIFVNSKKSSFSKLFLCRDALHNLHPSENGSFWRDLPSHRRSKWRFGR